MKHLLVNTLCVILTTKVTVRGTGHKAKPARRDGRILGILPSGQMLVMLMSDGTLETHDFDNVALTKDPGNNNMLFEQPTAEQAERMKRRLDYYYAQATLEANYTREALARD